jgi:uncharacterized Zn finger protein (UPF0148 family)
MEIVKANCPACGAPLVIPDNRDAMYCSSCGSSLAIDRGESSVTLKFAEKIVSAIEQAGTATQNAIRENAYVTRAELQRLQANQELSTLQLQLSNLQAEIRTVERSPISTAGGFQKLKLHQSEYELLDRMYGIYKRISTPDQADLQACINFANWEISWFRCEIAALSLSGQINRVQLINSLNIRTSELASKIAGLKIVQLRNGFVSYKQPDPSPSDSPAISALLTLLVTDEQNARPLSSSPEGKFVYNEIVTRHQKLKSWLVQGARKQIGEMLVSPKFRANPNDINSFKELLRLINNDLQIDFRKFERSVAYQYQKALLDRKNQTEKQIKKLEYRLQNGRNPGWLPAIVAAISNGFAGVFGAGSPKSVVTNTPSASIMEIGAVPPTLEPAWIPPSIPVNQPLKASDFISLGLGCLSSLAITVVISLIGLLVFGMVNAGKTVGGWSLSIFFLFASIGFALGASAFLSITSPSISIKGFGPLPRISINSRRAGKSIQNSRVIRLFIGLISCVFIYLIFLIIISLFTVFSAGLSAIFFLCGIVTGPILAILIARRTSIQ